MAASVKLFIVLAGGVNGGGEHRADSVLDEGGAPLTLAIVSSPPWIRSIPHKPHINSQQ